MRFEWVYCICVRLPRTVLGLFDNMIFVILDLYFTIVRVEFI